MKLMVVPMMRKKYLEQVYTQTADAIMDEKKYRELKAAGRLEQEVNFTTSETMRLKKILDDYEELRKIKEEMASKDKDQEAEDKKHEQEEKKKK